MLFFCCYDDVTTTYVMLLYDVVRQCRAIFMVEYSYVKKSQKILESDGVRWN